jgi:hypothetical protein
MTSTDRIERLPSVVGEAKDTPYTEALRRYLGERRHAEQTIHSYANCAGHFPRWAHGKLCAPCAGLKEFTSERKVPLFEPRVHIVSR